MTVYQKDHGYTSCRNMVTLTYKTGAKDQFYNHYKGFMAYYELVDAFENCQTTTTLTTTLSTTNVTSTIGTTENWPSVSLNSSLLSLWGFNIKVFKLDLSARDITEIASDTLRTYTGLQYLDLSHNMLSTIGYDTFEQLTNLRVKSF
jgi:hypothetical protein